MLRNTGSNIPVNRVENNFQEKANSIIIRIRSKDAALLIIQRRLLPPRYLTVECSSVNAANLFVVYTRYLHTRSSAVKEIRLILNQLISQVKISLSNEMAGP